MKIFIIFASILLLHSVAATQGLFTFQERAYASAALDYLEIKKNKVEWETKWKP